MVFSLFNINYVLTLFAVSSQVLTLFAVSSQKSVGVRRSLCTATKIYVSAFLGFGIQFSTTKNCVISYSRFATGIMLAYNFITRIQIKSEDLERSCEVALVPSLGLEYDEVGWLSLLRRYQRIVRFLCSQVPTMLVDIWELRFSSA